MRAGEVVAVATNGRVRRVPNTYEGIKDGVDQATIDYVGITERCGLYVDDNGMIEGQPLNVPASMFAGAALYGPVVLAGGADDEGETLPPHPDAIELMESLAAMWRQVTHDAARKGQTTTFPANAATVPGPVFVSLDTEEFDAYLRGEQP